MARDTLADYFYKRLAGYHNKVMWHVWNVEMGVQDSPNIPDYTWYSPKELDAELINKARGIIHDTLWNSGLGTTYAMSVAGRGAWVNNEDTYRIPVPVILDGTEMQVICEHIYNHAVAQGYRDNAMHKGIYLCPYPKLYDSLGVIASWPMVAAVVALPESSSAWPVNLVQYRTMQALLKIYSQTQGHTTIPGVGSKCIWARWTSHADQRNAAIDAPHWCDNHTKFIEKISKQLTYCSVCGNYVTANFGWYDDLHVGEEPNMEYLRSGGGFTAKCPYCETFEEQVPAVEDSPATSIQYATHYCPNCHKFQPTWAPYETENESKVVAALDGIDVYLSQTDLLSRIIGSIIPPAVLTAWGVAAWQATQVQHISPLVQSIKASDFWLEPPILGPQKLPSMDTPGAGLFYQMWKIEDLVGSAASRSSEVQDVAPDILQDVWNFLNKKAVDSTVLFDYREYYDCFPEGGSCKTPIPEEYAEPSSSNWTLKKTGVVILAILAVIALVILLTRKGIIVHHPYEGGLPTITTQKGGYGVPRCIKCEFDLMKQWAEDGKITRPINSLVLMRYASPSQNTAYIPDWFIDSSSKPQPGDPDFMI